MRKGSRAVRFAGAYAAVALIWGFLIQGPGFLLIALPWIAIPVIADGENQYPGPRLHFLLSVALNTALLWLFLRKRPASKAIV